MARTSRASSRRRATTAADSPSALERQIVKAAATLGRLVGQAESRWEGWSEERQQLASALATVRDRAAGMLGGLKSEAQVVARRAARVGKTAGTRASSARKRARTATARKTTRAAPAAAKRR